MVHLTQRTCVIIKPDGFEHRDEIVARYEQEGLFVAEVILRRFSRKLATEFYAEHNGKHFFGELIDFMTSGPVLVLYLEGENVIERVRIINGATDPSKADPGSIRGTYGDGPRNKVHGSDSPKSAARELALLKFPGLRP